MRQKKKKKEKPINSIISSRKIFERNGFDRARRIKSREEESRFDRLDGSNADTKTSVG